MGLMNRIAAAGFFSTLATTAFAQDNLPVIGRPEPGGTGFQPAATSIAADLQWLDGMVLIIITMIMPTIMGTTITTTIISRRPIFMLWPTP